MKNFTLIIPMLNSEKNKIPIEFQQDNKTGIINCVRSFIDIDLSNFTSIHFILLKEHEIKWHISEKIKIDLNILGLNDLPIVFSYEDEMTKSQSNTVYNEIKRNNIIGSIFIKDADNSCKVSKITPIDSVLVYSLENTLMVDPQHKSYVSIDDQNFLINIIEKKVISGMFNCGGYCFKDVQNFCDAYEAVINFGEHVYISNIIYWLMLNKNFKFTPIEANDYNDFKI